MTWQILIAISMVSSASSLLFQRQILKSTKTNPIAFSILIQLLVGLIIGAYLCFKHFAKPDLHHIWPNLIIMTLLYATVNIFRFKAIKSIHVSEFTILFQSSAVWTVLLAVLLLSESFGFLKIFGLLLIISGVFIVSLRGTSFSWKQGSLFAILSALTQGFAAINDIYIIRTGIDISLFIMLVFILPGIATALIFPNSISDVSMLLSKKKIGTMLIVSATCAVAASFYYFAYKVGNNIATLTTLAQITSIITVILSFVFLKETENAFKKVIAVVLTIIGAILVTR